MDYTETLGARCSVTFSISFETLAARLEMPVSEVRRLLDNEQLADRLNEEFTADELMGMSKEWEMFGMMPVDVDGGYF